MEIFHPKKDIPFMSYGKLTTFISLVTFLAAVYFLIAKGLHFGVDFTGGTVVELQYTQNANLERVRGAISKLGYTDVAVQNYGTSHDVMIRLPLEKSRSSAETASRVYAALCTAEQGQLVAVPGQPGQQAQRVCQVAAKPAVVMKRIEFVGPQVGKELVTGGLTAIALVCLGIIVYLAIRFEWKFAVSAIIANMHDVVIILGCFAAFGWEFNLTVLAAVLAVLGYSVNESVVVFDRIRENFRKLRNKTVTEIIDNAITATMSRTILTHLSTQLMVTSMLFLGGEILHNFALALTIGILFGIYSSVLVASPLLLMLGVKREDFVKPKKTEVEHALP
ncbi:protein translocase subunit SecF [Leeia aquatica]|uniref:Protein-export membrane protein SecF n=1 Tax=Leeia aquatica TaxID=2725557 RepID=A0A847SG51_9NEIS|nr:protein translocase subunit SecF [Leeia aquatica]NLR74922.1 protein translocase subunit SecF [Leeia aquatica]